MSALLKSASVGAITLFTEDLERSKLFYQEASGLPVAFEDENSAVFRLEEHGHQSAQDSCGPRVHRARNGRQPRRRLALRAHPRSG
jgi:catechol 2,3-dioxygenase-like lactoylglutathione lyase family enzyme